MDHSPVCPTTKVNALGIPIILKLTEGQAADGCRAADMLDTVGKVDTLPANSAYASYVLGAESNACGAQANIRIMLQRVIKPAFSRFSANIAT